MLICIISGKYGNQKSIFFNIYKTRIHSGSSDEATTPENPLSIGKNDKKNPRFLDGDLYHCHPKLVIMLKILLLEVLFLGPLGQAAQK